VGHVAKVKAAARSARAEARRRAHAGEPLTDAGAMAAILAIPVAARYRVNRRIVARALGIERAATGPVLVTRADARHAERKARDNARRK
jgi:hypothetical protein